MKGQALAIAMVVAAGVAMYVMYLSNFDSLARRVAPTTSGQRFARRLRLAEARAASAGGRDRRHPGRLGHRDARGLGCHAGHGADSTSRPRRGWCRSRRPPATRQRSLPAARPMDRARPTRRDPRQRRLRDRTRPRARRPGTGRDQRTARRLTIVGVALSPEYVYSIRPGELVPDDQRYGIFWMDETGTRRRLRHGGRLQRRGDRAVARSLERGSHRTARSHPRALWRTAAPSRAHCSSRTGPSRTRWPSFRVLASCFR